MGETTTALKDFQQAVFLNHNFDEARTALDNLQAQAGS